MSCSRFEAPLRLESNYFFLLVLHILEETKDMSSSTLPTDYDYSLQTSHVLKSHSWLTSFTLVRGTIIVQAPGRFGPRAIGADLFLINGD